MFSAELPWCCFCAEIKALGMRQKSTENIFGKYKKYWNEKLPEGSPKATTRVEPPLGRAPAPFGHPVGPPDLSSTPNPPINTETPRNIT